jgi:SOS-response transcriptional repressor LexA
MMGLTQKQGALLDYLRANCGSGRVSPSYGEIVAALGLAGKDSAHRLVHSLRERGYIDFLPGQARSIRLVEPDRDLHALSAIELRAYIAQAAGLAAFKDGDGGELTAIALRRIADRLDCKPRRAAA